MSVALVVFAAAMTAGAVLHGIALVRRERHLRRMRRALTVAGRVQR